MIEKNDPALFRGCKPKEELRLPLKINDVDEAGAAPKRWHFRAAHSRVKQFKELARKIRRRDRRI